MNIRQKKLVKILLYFREIQARYCNGAITVGYKNYTKIESTWPLIQFYFGATAAGSRFKEKSILSSECEIWGSQVFKLDQMSLQGNFDILLPMVIQLEVIKLTNYIN